MFQIAIILSYIVFQMFRLSNGYNIELDCVAGAGKNVLDLNLPFAARTNIVRTEKCAI